VTTTYRFRDWIIDVARELNEIVHGLNAEGAHVVMIDLQGPFNAGRWKAEVRILQVWDDTGVQFAEDEWGEWGRQRV
jgi:alpha-beta hydrolase superfamily lysophospholipase